MVGSQGGLSIPPHGGPLRPHAVGGSNPVKLTRGVLFAALTAGKVAAYAKDQRFDNIRLAVMTSEMLSAMRAA